VKKQHRAPAAETKPPAAEAALVIAPHQEARHDQKPFARASVKARKVHRRRAGRSTAVKPERLAQPVHKEVSPLPPSRGRGDELKPPKPAKPVKPVKPAKPEHSNRGQGQGQGESGRGNSGADHGNSGKKDESPPPTDDPADASSGHGKSGH
jgi:hypothetical protein